MSCEALSVEMDVVLENLRALLTNPSFVPIEEVESREDEILRLRQGWEKMEARWREAMMMMDSWRKRIADGGDSVNMDELRTGISLGKSIAAYPKSRMDASHQHWSSSAIFDDEANNNDDLVGIEDTDVRPDVVHQHQSDSEESGAPSPKSLRMSPRKPSALVEASGNARLRARRSPRKISLSLQDSGAIASRCGAQSEDADKAILLEADGNQVDTDELRIRRQVSLVHTSQSMPLTASSPLVRIRRP